VATLRQAAKGGTIAKWLYECSPRVGEMLFVPAGTLHAIGPGYLILEVQQPSDTTYRVYDWGRVGLDGKPRALHLDDAVEVTKFERAGALQGTRGKVVGPSFSMRVVPSGALDDASALRVIVAADGPLHLSGALGEERLERGDVVVAEPKDGRLELAGGSAVLLGEP
jgi:mannose-6-phosphate isomerase